MGTKRERAPGLWGIDTLYIVHSLYIVECAGFGVNISNMVYFYTNISNMIYKMRGSFHFPGIFVAFCL